MWIFLFLLVPLTLSGKEVINDTRLNYPQTSHYPVTPKVNVITGEHLEEEVDLVVAGCQPLSIRRFYSHKGSHHPIYCHWRFNPEHYCVANFCYKEQTCFAAFGEANGSITYCENRQETLRYNFSIAKTPGFIHSDQSGNTHPLNSQVTFAMTEGTQHDPRYCWEGTITTGSGSKRKFKSQRKAWLRNRSYYERGDDETKYTITPQVWTPYEIPITEEKLPNGNIIEYAYECFDHEMGHQEFILLKSITAYNSLKTKVLGKITFERKVIPNERMELTVIGSDQRKTLYTYKPFGINNYLSNVASPNWPEMAYRHCDHSDNRIEYISRGGDQFFITKYNRGSQVDYQLAPVGPDDEMCPISHYEYGKDFTKSIDAEGNIVIYRYDSLKRIIAVEIYEKNALYSVERYKWDEKTGNLMEKTLEDSKGKLFLKHEFDYDKNQNLKFEKISDSKESYATYSRYSEDGFNLKIEEWDDFGKKIEYTYYPQTNLLKTETIYRDGAVCKKTTHFYDDAAILVKSVVEDGSGFEKSMEITPKESLPCYGLPEVVMTKVNDKLISKIVYSYTPFGKISEEKHYDSKGLFLYSIVNEYDLRERLKSSIDPLGNKTTFGYDHHNRMLSQDGPKVNYQKTWTYDMAGRPKSETLEGQTKRIGYDKLGRVIWIIDEAGFETKYLYDALGRVIETYFPDGSIKKSTYDLVGNVVKEIDSNDYATIHNYNFRGQITSNLYPDGSTEFFVYRPDGRLLEVTDKNGSSKTFIYDIWDNVKEEREGDKVKTYQFLGPQLICETDAEGYDTFYEYDDRGRTFCEVKGNKKTFFSYDDLGRLSKTRIGNAVQVFDYDLLNRCTEKRVESPSEEVFEKEAYSYDALGNQIKVINSKGEQITDYNARCQPTKITDPCKAITTISYSYLGGLIKKITNPKGVQTTLKHDYKGQMIECSIQNGAQKEISRKTCRYDGEGNLKEEIHFVYEGDQVVRKVVNNWEYGPCNRLEKQIEGEKRIVSFSYDSKGRLATKTKADGTILSQKYDHYGRLKRYFAEDFDYQYEYDDCDRLLEIIDKQGIKTTRRYDCHGNMTFEKKANGLKLKTRFNDDGQKNQLILPDESEISYTYRGGRLHEVIRGDLKHIYSRRDLEGCVEEAILAGDLGKITIERDEKGRWKSFSSPFYTAFYPKDAYDKCGNLSRYSYVDAYGSCDRNYTYDDLDQLNSENEHSYAFDSLNNCINKNGEKKIYNTLCQEVSNSITYDLNGNVKSSGKFTYTYDSLDRLIKVNDGNRTINYTYDAFNRRLSKTIDDETTYYIWDDKNEIGSTQESGIIEELRVLGEGLGAEIGAAVLMEFNDVPYVPLHDHIGNVVSLAGIENQKITSNRYSAFGEGFNGKFFSPWTFSSKRYDKETDFIYFGRRYYCPEQMRWLTPDPQGFSDGPNLYAYVHNNPLTHFDLYGLKGVLNDLWDYFSKRKTQSENNRQEERRCGHYYPQWEEKCKFKSCCFNLGRQSAINFVSMHANGINVQPHELEGPVNYLSEVNGNKNVEGVYFRSQGVIKDTIECILSLVFGKMTTASILIKEKLERCRMDRPSAKIFLSCHSAGAIHVRNALRHCSDWVRQAVLVIAIAPAAYITKDLCLDVVHLTSKRDFVPLFDIKGRSQCRDTTRILDPHPDAPLFDHGMMSPTYKQPIRNAYKDFYEDYVKQK